MSLFACLLIAKDAFMVPTAIYVYVFEGEEGFELAFASFWVLTVLVIVFMVVHMISLARNLTGLGLLLSALVTAVAAGLTALAAAYAGILLTSLLEWI